ncbi:5' nucleotidase, NT5C type [Bifidobacterium callitrichidarum]|uniref:2-C-methyl-D-erythritol 4-phosphate cytidylyltransferase n=1 Tax=Bifidobacterium callitrichidarum TaxID=2052941 RepID=A0A2U2N947_9BIFI|nr:2-C-methyl-D-erythritol 4-phosphate cytidylyltransferase [Bifidobacterium callitrichidarum]PWG65622.1 2-C-methyl-D-erythritol 4-phosphate cytidylyltransferase [Bifidobacterium callitrichidarum]
MTINNQPVVCIDIDNTIADYTDALRMFIRQCGRDANDYPCPNPIAYDFSKTAGWPFTGDLKSFLWWHKRAVGDGLYYNEQPYEGAVEAIQTLHETGWRIIISTSRKDDTRGTTARWLKANNIPYDGLHFGDKTDIRFNVLIDDKPDVLETVFNTYDALILHPNHEYCKDIKGTVAFDSWSEVPFILNEEEEYV